MAEYVVRRLMLGVLTGLLVSVLIFVLLRIAPGDVVDAILGGEGDLYAVEVVEQMRERLGLNRPLPVQYLVFMKDFATLQWGDSLANGKPVWPQMQKKLPVTLELAVMAVVLSVLLGVPVGIVMALKQDTWIDYVFRVISLAGMSVPNFWTGTLMVLGGTLYFNWSPRMEYVSPFENPAGNFFQFLWPALATAWISQATLARMMRSSMLEVLRQDYIRTAHAKGLRNFVVTYRHAVKNALLPVVTMVGLAIAVTVGGAVIIESIFMLPGMGWYLVYSLNQFDYPVVQTLVLFFSIWIVVTNLLVDLSYGWLDPRIRY